MKNKAGTVEQRRWLCPSNKHNHTLGHEFSKPKPIRVSPPYLREVTVDV